MNSLITVFLYSHTCFYSPRPRQNRALSPAGNAMWHNTKGKQCETAQKFALFSPRVKLIRLTCRLSSFKMFTDELLKRTEGPTLY